MGHWSEIRNDYMREDEDGFVVITIDAWKTDDTEEGEIIADIIGKKVKDENVIFVNYRDYIAKKDGYAQEMIAEAKERLATVLADIGK